MAEYNYASNESLHRIYNALVGSPESSPIPDRVQGKREAWNWYLSRIAELLENSTAIDLALPGMEYGGIYINSGTVAIDPAKDIWAKVTGSFQGDMASSDNVTPDWSESKITVSRNGTYFVAWQVSFNAGVTSTVQVKPYAGGVGVETAEATGRTIAGGTGESVSGIGLFEVSAQPVDVELWINQTVTGSFAALSAQVNVWNAGLATGT